MTTAPLIIVLGGPNGAGKSTAARWLLPEELPFLNADEVAKSLPGYPSPAVDAEAARLVLAEMDQLEAGRRGYAIETTLAGRSLAARIRRLREVREGGYRFRLAFFWTPDAEFSIRRVAARVRAGGHAISESVIRQRHAAGRRNFWTLYRPIADKWEVYNSTRPTATFVAEGIMTTTLRVDDPEVWQRMREGVDDE